MNAPLTVNFADFAQLRLIAWNRASGDAVPEDDGYRLLRNTVSNDLGRLLTAPVTHLRQVRTERDKIFTVLQMDGIPVKVELVREGRIAIGGEVDLALNVPVLSRSDMYTQKLLANADRGLDKSVMSRDIDKLPAKNAYG